METLRLEKANCFDAYSNIRWSLGLSKIIRVKYENGVLKPLEPLELEEGEEVQITIRRNVRKVLEKYRGVLGKSSIKELLELEEEIHMQ